jgi:hypothetical protein
MPASCAPDDLGIPLQEEPDLAKRFGNSYREYCRHVPRLVPRLIVTRLSHIH